MECVAEPSSRNDISPLQAGVCSLWDVAAVYGVSVFVFSVVYLVLDIRTPGGAFAPREERDGAAGVARDPDADGADRALDFRHLVAA